MAKEQGFAGNAFGALGMLVPLVYFGGLIFYFARVGGGSLQGVIAIGLGPTVVGLSALGLLFSIKPLLMLLRLVSGVAGGPTKGPSRGVDDGAGTATHGDFDADDAIARYLAKRPEAAETAPAAAPHAPETPPAAPPRPAFGRKTA
ncbi:MAG: hypothetical protein RLZZ58_348 [Pseudomonadota bacterium]